MAIALQLQKCLKDGKRCAGGVFGHPWTKRNVVLRLQHAEIRDNAMEGMPCPPYAAHEDSLLLFRSSEKWQITHLSDRCSSCSYCHQSSEWHHVDIWGLFWVGVATRRCTGRSASLSGRLHYARSLCNHCTLRLPQSPLTGIGWPAAM